MWPDLYLDIIAHLYYLYMCAAFLCVYIKMILLYSDFVLYMQHTLFCHGDVGNANDDLKMITMSKIK